MKSSRFALSAAVLFVASACYRGPSSSAAAAECWIDEVSLGQLRRQAYFTLLERKQPQADTLRRLVSVPIQRDSLEAHSEVVLDRQLCRRAASAAEEPGRSGRFAVLRVGRTYWVRSVDHGWIKALDERFRPILTIVELN